MSVLIEYILTENDGKKNKWRDQKNGLPQGSVLSPKLLLTLLLCTTIWQLLSND